MNIKETINTNTKKFSNEKFVKFFSPKEDKHYKYVNTLIGEEKLQLAFLTFWLSEGKAGKNAIVAITDNKLIISSKRYLLTKNKQIELKKATFSYKDGARDKISVVKVKIGKTTQRFRILKSSLEEFKILVSR